MNISKPGKHSKIDPLKDTSIEAFILFLVALVAGYFIGFNAGLLLLMLAFGFWIGEHKHQLKNRIISKLKER